MRKKAVVFCSSSMTIDSKYNEAAVAAIDVLCAAGYDIVSGGGAKGTMDVIAARAAHNGVGNIGVLPRFMAQFRHPDLTELIWTDTMSERKEKMREGTSLALALPGGIGTLDELAETLCLAKLGLYTGRVIALNVDGFYDSFKALLDHYVATGMYSAQDLSLISFPSTIEELSGVVE